MKTTALLFRKNNFLILDSILNNGEYSITARSAVDPCDKVFEKPLKINQKKDKWK